jgi:hypothetical protein
MGVTSGNIMSGYSRSSISSDTEPKSQPIIKSIFLELNTALPASAACERMFFVAGIVFAPFHMPMSVEHFEQQLLLRLNHDKLLRLQLLVKLAIVRLRLLSFELQHFTFMNDEHRQSVSDLHCQSVINKQSWCRAMMSDDYGWQSTLYFVTKKY